MKYLNAADILPEGLLLEIQRYISGEMMYIPSCEERMGWGEKSGSRKYFEYRNIKIKQRYESGATMDEISQEFGLAYETIRKIIYKA